MTPTLSVMYSRGDSSTPVASMSEAMSLYSTDATCACPLVMTPRAPGSAAGRHRSRLQAIRVPSRLARVLRLNTKSKPLSPRCCLTTPITSSSTSSRQNMSPLDASRAALCVFVFQAMQPSVLDADAAWVRVAVPVLVLYWTSRARWDQCMGRTVAPHRSAISSLQQTFRFQQNR